MHSRRYSSPAHHAPRFAHHWSGGHRGRGGSRARRGDIRAAVLALVAERPMHGYEMIKEIEERSGGFWKPSAGSIYPTLQLLEDEGLIAGTEIDGKRRFELTDEGRAAVAEREGKAEAKPWEQVRTGAPPELVRLGQSLRQLAQLVGQALQTADEGQRAKIRELLDETRRRIYGILAEDE